MQNYDRKRKELGIDEQIKKFFASGSKVTECPPAEFSEGVKVKTAVWTFNNQKKK